MSKGSVLVIDDERDLVELVSYNLERAGFEAALDRAREVTELQSSPSRVAG